jgi:hypothetical protein
MRNSPALAPAPLVAAGLLALAVVSPTASALGTHGTAPPAAAGGRTASSPGWTKLGVTTADISQPGLVTGIPGQDSLLHVLWARPQGRYSDLVSTVITPGGDVGASQFVNSGWDSIWPVPDLAVVDPDSSLLAVWGGTRTTNPGDPNQNISAATSHPVGTAGEWNLQYGDVSHGQGGAASSIGLVSVGGQPMFTFSGSTGVFVHRGLDPTTADHDFQAALGGCCGYSPDLAVEPLGRVLLAWYSSAAGAEGVYVQDVAADGSPVGTAVRLPGSMTVYNGEEHSVQQVTRTPFAAGHGGGDRHFYVGYTGGYPSPTTMQVWSNSRGARVVGSGTSVHTPAVSTDDEGRAWVAWSEGGTGTTRLYARRSNVGGSVWGATVPVRLPASSSGCQTLYEVTPENPIDGDLDIIATLSQDCLGPVTLWHTAIEPGLTLDARPDGFSGRQTLRFEVTDAGEAVPGAKVTIGGKSDLTNASGVARVTLGPYPTKRKLTATVTHPRYVGDSVVVRARP